MFPMRSKNVKALVDPPRCMPIMEDGMMERSYCGLHFGRKKSWEPIFGGLQSFNSLSNYIFI